MRDPQVAHFGLTISLGPACKPGCAHLRGLWYCDCGAAQGYFWDKDGVVTKDGRPVLLSEVYADLGRKP